MIKQRVTKPLIGLLTLILTGLTLTVSLSLANGAPVTIFLSYLPDVSTYGSPDANGTAVVSIGEAWLELEAQGLPQLQDELYEAWVIDAETGEMRSFGKFNAAADGTVDYKVELDNLVYSDYRYFVISVEPEPDPDPEADPRWTIGGVFPNPELLIVSGTATPVQNSNAEEAAVDNANLGGTPDPLATAGPPGPPPALPETGQDRPWLGLGVSVLGLLLLAAAGLYRRRQNTV